MANETTEVAQELSNASDETVQGTSASAETEISTSETPPDTDGDLVTVPEENHASSSADIAEGSSTESVSTLNETDTSQEAKVPDDIDPFITKVCETIQHEVDDAELDKFLRTHIKTFREEWDTWRDEAKDAYLHMMASQLVQRKAAKTRIMMYEKFKLPVPSAQTKLFESIQQSQVKPKRCIPVLLLPPNLRPTYSLKK
jgi:hypothetical protein